MTPEEAQQAQTIEEIRKECIFDALNPERGISWTRAEKARNKLLKIVDSQAQKIKEQAKEIERLKAILQTVEPTVVQALNNITDSKEVAR